MATKAPLPPRGVLSLWTGTPMFRPHRGALLVTTLAVSLARRVFPEVEFVTDTGGAFLARLLGWQFGQVNLALDRLNDPGLAHIWALGKFYALLEQSGPCVQFDGDFLIFKPLRAKFLEGRLVAQSPDYPAFYRGPAMERGREILGFTDPNLPAYNAGVLGGRDVALVHDYAFASIALAEKFRDLDREVNGTATSMLVEQMHLGVFARRRRAAVRILLPESPTRRQVALAGISHLSGGNKRHPYYVERVENRLRREFPEALEEFESGWRVMEGKAPGWLFAAAHCERQGKLSSPPSNVFAFDF